MSPEEKKKYKVFLIEDEPAIVDLYRSAFEREGFEIESVYTGKDALSQIEAFKDGREERPDVIVADILLPDVSGLEILKEIRRSKEFDSVPVIMLTNYGTREIKETIQDTPNARHVLKMDTSPVLFVKEVWGIVQTKTA
ncbi:MAG: response regulator [Patescibacteria group bacterium]|nr:response regulator [bacterium]MDZ4240677.1 response regulator [Patescibacteria group bacterium]